jgi:hypothetical protein
MLSGSFAVHARARYGGGGGGGGFGGGGFGGLGGNMGQLIPFRPGVVRPIILHPRAPSGTATATPRVRGEVGPPQEFLAIDDR